MPIVTTLPHFKQPDEPAPSVVAIEEPAETIEELTAQLQRLQGLYAELQEKYAAEKIVWSRDLQKARDKFSALDAVHGQWQTAVAELVAEDDQKRRLAIRNGLKAE